jgi:SH3-like domain-containing protein
MQTLPKKSHWLVVLIWFFASCAPQAASGGDPQAWIDAPLDGMQLPLAPYEIVAHAEDPSGIAQFEFNVNGNVIATTAGSAGSLSTVRQMWNPAAPGDYVISVRAMNTSGTWGGEAVVHVNIYDAQFKTPVPLTATAPALSTPTLTPVSLPIFVLIKNANCRFGPGQAFNEVDAAFAGDSVSIEGKSEDGTWWLVRLPNGTLCWVSGLTGNATGDFANAPVVQSPPTPIPTQEEAQGCYVFDPNQQPVCTVPCPGNAQPGGACTP